MASNNRTPERIAIQSRPGRTSCRISNWHMRNFKSVIDQEIDLSALTVLVGPNSSGKSSLIQSILFMAQNAQIPQSENSSHDLANGLLQLNGDLVQLGTHREVLNDSLEYGAIGIGGKIEISSPTSSTNESRPNQEMRSELRNEAEEIRTLDWNLTLKEPSKGNSLSGVVESDEACASLYLQEEELESISSYSLSEKDLQQINEAYFGTFHRKVASWEYNFEKNAKKKNGLNASKERRSQNSSDDETIFRAVNFTVGIPTSGLIASPAVDVFISQQENFMAQSMKVAVFEELKRILSESYDLPVVLRTAEQVALSRAIRARNVPLRRSYECSNGHKFASLKQLPKCPFCLEIIDSESQVNKKTQSPASAQKKYISAALKLLEDDDFERILSSSPLIDPLRIDFSIGLKSSGSDLLDEIIDIKETFPYQEVGKVLKKYDVRLDERIFRLIYDQVYDEIQKFWSNVRDEIISQTKGKTSTPILLPQTIMSSRSPFRRDIYEDDVVDGIKLFQELLQSIVYLGPLRAEPVDLFARFQGFQSDQMPLGRDGGYLAQKVYEDEKRNHEDWPLPPDSTHVKNQRVSFRNALEDWMRFLGIGSSIKSIPQGHYGYFLTVDGKSLRVMGTGISQVLPVIALCLLAPRNSVILLEEPELHLHPKIQQRLGDFFLAVCASGKQAIIETHSEYLITRLRLIAAKRPEEAKLFRFIFTSKKYVDGHEETVFEPMSADSSGELPPWPQGFFDQVTEDIKDLIVSLASKNIDESD